MRQQATGIFWKRRGILKHPGTIDVRIGPLIEADGHTATDVNRQVENWIETNVQKLPSKL